MQKYGKEIVKMLHMDVESDKVLETARELQRPARNNNVENEKSRQRFAILEDKLKSRK